MIFLKIMYKRKSRHYYTYFKTKEAKKGREGGRLGYSLKFTKTIDCGARIKTQISYS